MKKNDTSWEVVAEWYDEHLDQKDTYHSKVIFPHLSRMLQLTGTETVLDLACGQGFFTDYLAKHTLETVACDLSPKLVAIAREYNPNIVIHVADASHLSFAKNASFDVVVCILALQNMEDLVSVCNEVARVLKPNGRFVFVLNHPAFRIPKQSSWGFEGTEKQYRRIDRYLSPEKTKIAMHPGTDSSYTISFHRSLQDFMKALRKNNFCITSLEEWISHRVSGKGLRAKAEDTARKEIPLFMAIEARKLTN